MGQRSQIYVFTEKGLQIANYYQWNYGTRMLSRARYGIEYAISNINCTWLFDRKGETREYEKFRRYWDINFNYKDIVMSSDIIKEAENGYTDDFADYVLNCDNNDGKLFVLINTEKQTVKYALTDDENNILTPTAYLEWDDETYKQYAEDEEIQFTKDNIDFLNQIEMLTADELENLFLVASLYIKPNF